MIIDSQPIFAALRDVLAELYRDQEDAHLLVADAGLDPAVIAFSPRARTNWHNILAVAVGQNRVDRLLGVARNDYLDNPALAAAYTAYRAWLDGGGQWQAPPPQPDGGDVITTQIGDQASVVAVGKNISQVVYQGLTPPALDAATLAAAQVRLAQLPLDNIPPVAPLPPGSRLPLSMNPLFVGRETDLRWLAATLKGGATVAVSQIAAATGLGGIGKTQLAVAFAHHYGQFFAGGVYWLNCADPAAIPAEVALCGATMPDLRADFATLDLPTQVRLVLAAWQSPLPRLLIFDNCEQPSVLAQWRPPSGGSRVLVTSRRRAWDHALGVQTLALATLPRQQSVALLRKFRPDLAADDAHLEQIAGELGDLPLALHLAGSYLARYRSVVSPAHYLAQLRQPDLLQHRSLQAGDLSPTGHVQHVARTFALSYARLDPAHPPDALAQTLLAHAAHFAPGQPIPRPLLLAGLELTEEAAQLQAADALEQLTNLGLLEPTDRDDLLIHRLVVHFVQQVDAAATQAAQQAVAAALRTAANRINDTGIPGPLLVWQTHLHHITDTVQSQADAAAAGLCNTLGFHLHMIGDYAAAHPYLERALAIREQVLGANHPNTAGSLNNLGYLLQAQGDYAAARPYYERALTIWEQILGTNHSDTALSLNNLGTLLHEQGDYITARPYFERALAIREQVLGASHPDTATSLNNLGYLLDEMGDYAAARPYYERSLAICEQVLGAGHPDTATSLNNLGHLLDAMGDYAAARPYYERSLAIREAVLGNSHPDTASSLNNLGALLRAQGDYAAARPYFERALAICETVLGDSHPDTAGSLNNLGALLQAMGDYAAARPYLERALAILEQILGVNHPNTAGSLNNLGTLLHEQGDYAAARLYYERALAIHETVLGVSHPDTALSLNNLGYLLQAQGDHAAARPYFERALAICEQRLGPAHPSTQTVRGNLNALPAQAG